jgi:hypothetical protein
MLDLLDNGLAGKRLGFIDRIKRMIDDFPAVEFGCHYVVFRAVV